MFLPDEHKQWQAVLDFMNSRGRLAVLIKAVPLRKQVLSGGPQFDWFDRIWLPRHTTGEAAPARVMGRVTQNFRMQQIQVTYDEPPVFAAFNVSGTYLGELQFPLGTRQIVFGKQSAWGVCDGADGAPNLVEFQLPMLGDPDANRSQN